MDPFIEDDQYLQSIQDLCQSCKDRSKNCPTCHSQNDQNSLKNIKDLEKIFQSFIVRILEKKKYYLELDYKIPDAKKLYHPKMSNKDNALRISIKVLNNLKKQNKLAAFQLEINKTLRDKHAVFLSSDQAKDVLSRTHCFMSINYAEKTQSRSQKIRYNKYFSIFHIDLIDYSA